MANDLLGNELTDTEAALLDAFATLKALLDRDDLTPAISANVKESIASLWQAINDLALTDERPSA